MQSDQPFGEDDARRARDHRRRIRHCCGHLSEALDKYKVPAAEHKELMAIVETLRKDIVEKH